MKTLDPRVRVLYLAAIAIGIFFLRELWQVGAVLALQCALWLIVKLPPRLLLRKIGKLWGFAAFIIASYALTREDPSIDRWGHIDVWKTSLAINLSGAIIG